VHGIYGNDVTVDMRIRGYRKALEKHGIGYSPDMVIDVGEGEDVFEKKLHFLLNAKAAAPDAIFGACFHAAKKLFDRLPREFLKNRGIIVYDDHRRELKALGIPYCIVSQPLERIGKAAIEGLYELLRENQEPIQICFPSQIVEMR